MHPKPKVPIYQQGLRGPGIGVVVTSTWALSAPGGYRPMSCPSILECAKGAGPRALLMLRRDSEPMGLSIKIRLMQKLGLCRDVRLH